MSFRLNYNNGLYMNKILVYLFKCNLNKLYNISYYIFVVIFKWKYVLRLLFIVEDCLDIYRFYYESGYLKLYFGS